MAIIGIDLGTTNSLVCVCQDDHVKLVPSPLGQVLTPSVVSVEEDGSIEVGAVAKERLVSHPEATAASFKRYMGTSQQVTLRGQRFTPQELSSFVLRQLKKDAEEYLGEEISEAVISVPAYFNDHQRYATREAGELAGLHVERLINEPSAAALAASRISQEEEGSYLVFDFGGGTLDVSIVDYFDNVIEIIAVSGDNHLGGDDFDEVIARKFCTEHQMSYDQMELQKKATLLRLAENCKRTLTSQNEAVLTWETEGQERSLTLTNITLAELCQEIFDRMGQVISTALRDSGRTIEEIDEVVLVGGSSKMPVIAFYLQTYLNKKPCMIGSPDEVVAVGAGLYAGIKERRKEIRDLVLTDICPFTLGTDIVNYSDTKRPIMSPIIERNSILPSSKVGYYTNSYDNQTHISVGIYQGEAYYCEENIKLGVIEMDILPVPKGKTQLKICFTYDINGILEVEVTDYYRKNTVKKVLACEQLRLSEEELERRIEELKRYHLTSSGGVRAKLVLARGERMFSELLGEKRQEAGRILRWLQEQIAEKSDQEIAKSVKEAEAAFDQLEESKR